MISPAQKKHLKELMTAQIAELEASIPRLEEGAAPVSPDSAIGRLSRTDSMINAATIGMALKDARNRLTRLRNRLERIDDPAFDTCGLCGEPIPYERLKAAPDRGTCSGCMRGKGL